MSNIQGTIRRKPITSATVLGTTPGAFPIVHGTYLGDSGDPGVDATDAHFKLVKTDSDNMPPRYIQLLYNTTGTDKANVASRLVVEFWDPIVEQWHQSAPMSVAGSAALDAAGNTTIGEFLSVEVPRGATLGRFWVPVDLSANQGLSVTAYALNET
jgi:hypothetical protein